ncbi:MAG TPA: hypothetical protein VGF29_07730 [Hyphomicrobiaceae bacterium]|jgi:hypothetical protein
MALDTRWKNPQGKDPEALWRWAQDTTAELRKGAFLSGAESDISDLLTLVPSLFASVAVQSFTTSGANTYTPTANMVFALVFSTGAGGGGGGADANDGGSTAGGAGGAAGGTCIELFTAAQIGASQTVTVGAKGTGGAASTGANGTAGGNTTFGALHTATGGGLGAGLQTTTDGIAAGGTGGVPTGGLINLTGGDGGNAAALNTGNNIAIGGDGGASFWGGGGKGGRRGGSSGVVAPQTGKAPGSGGGGGAAISSNETAGADGADGICVVVEFIGASV